MHQFYKLIDDKGDKVYIPKPYIIAQLLKLIQSKEKPPLIIQLNDFQLNPCNIPTKHLLSLFPLLSSYKQVIKHIAKTHSSTKSTVNANDRVFELKDYLLTQGKDDYTDKPESLIEAITDHDLLITSIRKALTATRAAQLIPYSFKEHDVNSYYEVPNFLKQQSEMKARPEIVALLQNTTQPLPCDEYILISILADYNYNEEYIEINDLKGSKFLTKKMYLMRFILRLINNEPIPHHCYVEDDHHQDIQIDFKSTLMTYFAYTPSSYLKDGVLIDLSNTLYESFLPIAQGNFHSEPQYCYNEEGAYKIPPLDLFEFMEIQDINNNPFIVRKPFVRSLLYKSNPLLNVSIRDSANQLRFVSPIAVLGPQFSNLRQYNESLEENRIIHAFDIFIKVKDITNVSRLIRREAFEAFGDLLNKGKIKSNEVFTVIDRNLQRFQSTIALMIPKDKKVRQWVLVNDVNNKKCLIYKHLLLKILAREYSSRDEFAIVDFNNKERRINPHSIKSKLKSDYEKKSNRKPAILPQQHQQLAIN